MKKLLVSALAAAVALTTFVGAADAKQWKKHHYPQYHYSYYHRDYDYGPAIVAGAIFGMMGAALASQQQPYYGYYGPYYNGPPSHTAWCQWRYKTYSPATDQFYAKPGVLQYCHSPFDY